jgi:hypothetical protein
MTTRTAATLRRLVQADTHEMLNHAGHELDARHREHVAATCLQQPWSCLLQQA